MKYLDTQVDGAAVQAHIAKKDTVITTEYGDALITEGNYIVTFKNKTKVGMTPQDFEGRYIPAENKSNKNE